MLFSPDRLISRGSPFELQEADVGGVACRVFKHAPKTLADLYRASRRSSSQEFLVCQGRRFLYAEMFKWAAAVARVLVERCSVQNGSRVALILDNVPEWVAAFIGTTALGATVVLVHKRSAPATILAALDAARCSVAITDSATVKWLHEHHDLQHVLVVDGSSVDFTAGRLSAFPDRASDGNEALLFSTSAAAPEQVGIIAFTSGSTGQPKGVELTHQGVVCGLMNMLLGSAMSSAGVRPIRANVGRSPPVSVVVAPLSHVSGYANLLLTMHLGGKLGLAEQHNATAALALVASEAATSLVGATPAMIRELLKIEGIGQSAESLRVIIVQGNTPHGRLLADLQAKLPQVSVGTGYGMTETNGSICVASEAVLRERPATSGQPLPTVTVRIVVNDGTAAPVGEKGEVWLRGAMVMRGYCNQPEATLQVLQNGWLRTGDIGCLDPQGYLYIIDRASQLVECGSMQVSCAALEGAVLDNALTDEAAAFATHAADGTERLILALSSPDGSSLDYAKIRELLVEAGCDDLSQARILLLSSLPRTVSGKVDRAELRRRVQAHDPLFELRSLE